MLIKSAEMQDNYLVHTVEINGRDERFYTPKEFIDGNVMAGLKRSVDYVQAKRDKQMRAVG